MTERINLLIGMLLVLSSFSVFSQPSNPAMDQYKLGAGDKIHIRVYGEEQLSMETRLPDVGTISYPFLGEIRLVGLTLSEVEGLIFSGLEGDYLVNPSVSVTMVEYRPFFIDGEVKRPGGYPYQPGLSINKAAALAGGYTERASKTDIVIIRDTGEGKETLEVSVSSMVQPGDIITVNQRFF